MFKVNLYTIGRLMRDAMRYLAVGLQEINTRQAAPQSVADNEYRII